jgi:hypothetical protein
VTRFIVARQRTKRLAALAASEPPGDIEALLLSCRGPGPGRLTLLPLLLFLGGGLPVIAGACSYSVQMIRVLRKSVHMAYVEPSLLAQSRALFIAQAWLAWPGIIGATLVGAGLLVAWRRRWQRPPSAQTTAMVATVCVLGAVGLFIAAGPFRAENRMPWPAECCTDRVLEVNVSHPYAPEEWQGRRPVVTPTGRDWQVVDEPNLPKLRGPYDLERAPLLWIGDQQISFNGFVTDLELLEGDLRNYRSHMKFYKMPDPDWWSMLIVLAVAETPMPRLTACLQVALRTHARRVIFAFTNRETIHRPVLGTLSRVHESGVRVTLTREASPDVSGFLVRAKDFATYDALAHRLVELGPARTEEIVLGI